jgi:hypothetical protein
VPRTCCACRRPARSGRAVRRSRDHLPIALLPAKRHRNRPDPLTIALGVVAGATAGSVIVGQVLRLTRRRIAGTPSGAGVLESAEQALGAATQAAQDSVTVAREGLTETSRGELVLFNILSGFTASFLIVRVSTWGIRGGWWPLGNVRVGGRHVHQFVPGILLAFAAGGAAMVTRSDRAEELLAFPFGAGVGLTFDEAALLLQLEDVYWSREGILSVQVSLAMSGVLGATIIALRILRRGERSSEQAGLIPDESGEYLYVPTASGTP